MIRFLGRRFLVLVVRIAVVAFSLLLLIELSFGVIGDSGKHVWEMNFPAPALPTGDMSGTGEWNEIVPLMQNSLLVAGLAWGVTLCVGYAWGILAARLRNLKGHYLLIAPWLILACIPGFWWVLQVAIYSYFAWERPGFANEIIVESGPDLMRWWNAAVVALPLAVLGVSVLIQEVNQRIREEAVLPFVSGLRRAGYPGSDIFYRNILRRLTGELAGYADRPLPLIFGGLIFAEAAFQYEGMGLFLIRSLEAGNFPGIFVTGLWIASVLGVATLVREALVHTLQDD